YSSEDTGRPKLTCAVKRLKSLNPLINIHGVEEKLTKENLSILGRSDVLIDALDNFETRFLLNEYAVSNGIPLVHGAIEGFYGRIITIILDKTACLRCIYPHNPQVKKPFPVIGTIAGIVGVIEANEVIKLLTGIGETLAGKLLMIDLKRNSFSTIEMQRQKGCPVCGRA
ncbi:MAG: HesA/MoeB/ThiF family protein, partial [Synergistetes bacterium]|nr:HesA/MoeB/ThiF family protein [Synergistota bacterium]